MIDTHTHLYSEQFADEGNGDLAVKLALEAGVARMIFPNCDGRTAAALLSLHARHPEVTYVAKGLHPTEIGATWRDDLHEIKSLFADVACVAIGEVGIDLYWDKSYELEQCEALCSQLQWGVAEGLPVILHCREGLDQTLECIRGTSTGSHPMVFHSFTGNADDVRTIRRTVPEAMFGINGVVTFKSARSLREALPEIGADHILLETDSPYLAPVPHRGKRNESAYLPLINRTVAEHLSLTPEEMEQRTDNNARRIFRL